MRTRCSVRAARVRPWSPPRVRSVDSDRHGHSVRQDPRPRRRLSQSRTRTEVIVFVHGIAGSSTTWVKVMERLDPKRYTMVAPDLLGHGESAKPRGDYSLGAYAPASATSWWSSASSAPRSWATASAAASRCNSPTSSPRCAGGSCSPAAAGSARRSTRCCGRSRCRAREYVLPVILTSRVHGAAGAVGRFLGKFGLRGDPFWEEVWASYTRLTDARTQRAFVHTIRAVIDVAGQRGQRPRPPLPRPRSPHVVHLGRPRRRDPGRPRLHRPRPHAREPARDRQRKRALRAHRTARRDRGDARRLPHHDGAAHISLRDLRHTVVAGSTS